MSSRQFQKNSTYNSTMLHTLNSQHPNPNPNRNLTHILMRTPHTRQNKERSNTTITTTFVAKHNHIHCQTQPFVKKTVFHVSKVQGMLARVEGHKWSSLPLFLNNDQLIVNLKELVTVSPRT